MSPAPHPAASGSRSAQRVAWIALAGGAVIMGLKFAVFGLTNSAAVLSDALESIVNLLAAAFAAWSTWYAAQPPDRMHPYGHGKAEFFAVGFEGVLVVAAGISIIIEAIRRLTDGSELGDLSTGTWLLLGVNILLAGLALFVWRSGRKLVSPTLIADGKHLMADVVTTFGVIGGLVLVQVTGETWLDAAIAIAVAGVIFITGGRLMRESWRGLMDQQDIADDLLIRRILDEEVAAGQIVSYHKVRHRHTGRFHWVDLHIQMPATMTVKEAHDRASRIEGRIERELGHGNATAHIEPAGQN